MSGAGKNIVQKVTRGIDWDYLAKVVVSDEGRRELGALRRSFDDVSNTLETKFSTKETNIDWSFYKAKLGPKIVDTFKTSFESLEIAEYEDKLTPEYKTKYEAMLTKATQLEEESKREVVRLDKEIEKIRKDKESLRTRTVDDYFAQNPKLKEEIDNEIRAQNWG
ncbi:F-type H+-transporting ATPase subunit d [Marchantia polymorpha subsp. ruderalis]|uniref:Zn-dependent PLC domain-containing protein n=2 Tax=Marchantia polymorpha TaxID=3197 RepID=A0A176WK08_MARPO|nr:hypothetical protein AXG93_3242s1490 [Marchantia polymorpha subsp. ruderalis]PTQ44030.1 hypothetical protein MARPO_0022s0127 [Marchantia polymorpha]BBN04374.1 hypothetical protein Mp_3g04040 [Marchantia polymorpha subsp. ruderalis]|eukprot:PTQ44030.1 hypothetical protein MARPO_0022s0127 [Marchantia polymorpha]